MDDLVAWTRAQLDEDVALAPGVHLEACDSVRRHVDRNQVVWQVGPCNCGCPARVLREVEAKRLILKVAESWRHRVVEDCWYTCPAATEQREGEVSCNDNWEPGQGPCNCGVDQRRHAVLGPLALPYADRPGYREEWRP